MISHYLSYQNKKQKTIDMSASYVHVQSILCITQKSRKRNAYEYQWINLLPIVTAISTPQALPRGTITDFLSERNILYKFQ